MTERRQLIFRTAAEIEEQNRERYAIPATPEPECPPTWKELVVIEPRLVPLRKEARAYHKTAGEHFCANAVFFGYQTGYPDSLKGRLSKLVGWERRGHPLGTSAAYDVAYETIYKELPDCRHDGWLC
jgi:hypothetical protein